MLSGKEDRENVLRARELGKGVLTALLPLLKTNRLGVILTFPVYKINLPPNVTQLKGSKQLLEARRESTTTRSSNPCIPAISSLQESEQIMDIPVAQRMEGRHLLPENIKRSIKQQ